MSINTPKQRVFEKGHPIAAAGSNVVSRTLPPTPMKSLTIKVGTAVTVSAGTPVATTTVKSIRIRFNGVEIVNINGSSYDDTISMGMLMLREWNSQVAKVAEPANRFKVPLGALPAGATTLEYTMQSAQNIGANVGETITAGDHDVVYMQLPKDPKPAIPHITTGIFPHTNATGEFYDYLPAVGFPLRALIMVTHDSGTVSNTTFDSLIIEHNTQPIFDGTIADLQTEGQDKSGLALNTGLMLKTFGPKGIIVTPSSLLLKFTAGTAGTLKYIEWMMIAA